MAHLFRFYTFAKLNLIVLIGLLFDRLNFGFEDFISINFAVKSSLHCPNIRLASRLPVFEISD